MLNLGGADIQHGWSKMVFDYSELGDTTPATSFSVCCSDSYNNGNWNIGKFRSTTAVADGTTLGWIDNTTDSPITVVGTSGTTILAPYSVTVMATVAGDFDLNGDVGASDLAAVLGNYGFAGVWAQGDVNYNGSIGAEDLAAVLGNYGSALPAEVSIVGSHIDAAGIAL